MQLFVNLAITDLPATKTFFEGLGFAFHPQFSDEKALCMIINEHAYYMLLTEPFFQSFTNKKIADLETSVEAFHAISVESRGEVDTFVDKALSLGATPDGQPPEDHGFMYGRNFRDLDGHVWNVFWMDPAQG